MKLYECMTKVELHDLLKKRGSKVTGTKAELLQRLKRSSKKRSKKVSRRGSKKVSRRGSKKVSRRGSKKASRRGSKKVSRRGSKNEVKITDKISVTEKVVAGISTDDKNTFAKFYKSKSNSGIQHYSILDNGGTPFYITVNNGMIKIDGINHEASEENGEKLVHDQDILTIKDYKGYWVGYDTSPLKEHGNSILVQVNDKKYIYIGSEIYSFETADVIIGYTSDIGNSLVPYPIAFSETNLYFMLEKIGVPQSVFITPITIKKSSDLYSEFYSWIPKYDSDSEHKKHKN